MEYKVAVIGGGESVLGFRALGLEVFPTGPEEAERTFSELLSRKGRYAIIYITEELAAVLRKEIDGLKDELMPAVIPIPSGAGSAGLGMDALRKAVERAVGANILGEL